MLRHMVAQVSSPEEKAKESQLETIPGERMCGHSTGLGFRV